MSCYCSFYAVADDGTLTVNGALTAAHFGEHRLAIIAEDHGVPALRSSRAEVIVRIDRVNSSSATTRHTTGIYHSSAAPIDKRLTTTALFSRATLPPFGGDLSLLLPRLSVNSLFQIMYRVIRFCS